MAKTKQRRWTEKIFEHMKAGGLHPTDVKYMKGYFIFEHGSDMVVNFHIKELKGWLFGIWWDVEGEKKCDFFAQYERDIDKFKPSASKLVVEDMEVCDYDMDNYMLKMCRFIKKHPYRAWALDQTYQREAWEIEEVYKGCFVRFWKEMLGDHYHEYRHKKMTKQYLKLVKMIADICLDNYEIVDENVNGWVSSPRFEIKCDDVKGENLKPGLYNIDLKEELDEYLMKKVTKYNKKNHDYDIMLGDRLPVFVRRKK